MSIQETLKRAITTRLSSAAADVVARVLVAWCGAFALTWLCTAALGSRQSESFQQFVGGGGVRALVHLAAAVSIGPALETIFLGLGYWVASRLLKFPEVVSVVACASASATLHGIVDHSVVRGIATFWPFVVFTSTLVAWERRGLWRAIATTTVVHAIYNLPIVFYFAIPLISGILVRT